MQHLIALSLGLWLVSSSPARADITIEYSDDSTAAIYRSGTQVYFETCKAGKPAGRGCSGDAMEKHFANDHDAYTRSVQSFFGLIDRRLAGVAGVVDLDRKISEIKNRIENADLTAEELRQALEQLREWANWRGYADDAQRKILRFLEAGDNMVFTARFQQERVEITVFAFFNTTFLADQKRVYRLSGNVNWNEQETGCSALGANWKPTSSASSLGDSIRTRLAQAPIAKVAGANQLWTTSMKPPRYRLSCHCPASYEKPRERIQEISLDQHEETGRIARVQLKAHENFACYSIFSGPCVLMHMTSGSFSYLYREVTLLDLTSASSGGAIQTVPDNASIPHPVLCEREFDPKSGIIPPAAGAFDFSVPNLDRSFENLAQLLYTNRATFFRHLAKTLKQFAVTHPDDLAISFRAVQARAFALNVVNPLMHDIQTARVVEDILPIYDRAVKEWNTKLKTDSLARIELTPEVYRMALETFRAGLTGVQSYLSGDDVKTSEALTLALGQSMAKGPADVKALAAVLKEKQAFLTKLTESARTHGFGVMLQSITAYLEAKLAP